MARRRNSSRSGGKIKNWSRNRYTAGQEVYRWDHDHGPGKVVVEEYETGAPWEGGARGTGRYVAYYENTNTGKRIKIIPDPRSNKEKVKKQATSWMRRNPNPR